VLDGRLKQFRAASTKPVLLEEVGYTAYPSTENQQASYLMRAIQTTETNKAAGWIIWQAFDLSPSTACDPSDCPGVDNAEYHFGLWHTDGSPKLAVAAIKQWISSNLAAPTSPTPSG